MNVKKKCVVLLAMVIIAMAACAVVVSVHGANPTEVDRKVKFITHEEYVNNALDPNSIYIMKVEGIVSGENGDGYILDCEYPCGHDYIAYNEDIPVGMVVTSYMLLDNKHDYEVLARYDVVGGQLVSIK